MSERSLRRVRVAFEPSRFSSEQLINVYEPLKPVESRAEVIGISKRDLPQKKIRSNMRGEA